MKQNKIYKSYRTGILTVLILSTLLLAGVTCLATEELSEIRMVLSSNQVTVGQPFNLTIELNPTEAISGWSLSLHFNQTLIQATNITPGEYWTSFFDAGKINNSTGTITNIQTWSTGPYPNSTHTLCTIRLRGIQPGVCTITIEKAEITNSVFTLLSVITHNITIQLQEHQSINNGYLLDNNGDGIYDSFQNSTTGNETNVEKQENGTYLIDTDGDDDWDYLYDPDNLNKETSQDERETLKNNPVPLSLISISFIIGIVILLCIIFLLHSRKKGKHMEKNKNK